MGGVACCFHRSGAPAREDDLAEVAAALAWRSADGAATWLDGPVALANFHFWTTPEEVGEIGPRVHQASGLALAFDGRLDNREELIRALAAPPDLSDAELALRAWLAWGEDCLPRLLGPFALIAASPRERAVWLARDPIGNRGLAFHLGPGLLLAASDEHALAADSRVGRELDDSMLALYFSLENRSDGRTFFRGIEQLLPGELLRVGPERAEKRTFYRPPPPPGPRRPEEWQEEFRDTLRQAVACRLRTAGGKTGILLSGGLDSNPIAALAREARPAASLASFTWAFPRHPECDERSLAAETIARFALEAHDVPCDDAGPLAGIPPGASLAEAAADRSWPLHPGTPEQNAYRLFHQRSYEAAAASGARILLSGMCGDQIYSGADSFVADFWRERRFGRLAADLVWHLRQGRLGAAAFRDLLPASFLWRRRARRRRLEAPWLTAAAFGALPAGLPWPSWAAAARRPEQVLRIFDPTNAHGINVECYYALRLGVSPRYPWRDRRIVELALQLPGFELRNRNVKRPILRAALRDSLPQNVIDRSSKTSFEPIFRHSLLMERPALIARLLDRPDACWPLFVEKSYLGRERLRVPGALGALLIWTCIALELWLLRGGGKAGAAA
jgi:asparagine synthase (glutamine-hydrolysing)